MRPIRFAILQHQKHSAHCTANQPQQEQTETKVALRNLELMIDKKKKQIFFFQNSIYARLIQSKLHLNCDKYYSNDELFDSLDDDIFEEKSARIHRPKYMARMPTFLIFYKMFLFFSDGTCTVRKIFI